jgi:hypothetical protein
MLWGWRELTIAMLTEAILGLKVFKTFLGTLITKVSHWLVISLDAVYHMAFDRSEM